MSDAVLHVLVGDWIGEALSKLPDARVHKGFITAVLAFASHAILDQVDQDYTPNWTKWRTDAKQLQKDLPYVAQQVTGLAVTLVSLFKETDRERFQTRLAGILGALAPDIIDGVYAYLHPDAWQTGQLHFPWHRTTQGVKREMSREAAMSRTAYLTLLKLQL